MKIFLLNLIRFGFIMALVLSCIINFYDYNIYRKKDEYVKYKSYNYEKNIVLGSSHSMTIIPNRYFNFGSGSQTLDTSEMILLDVLSKTVVENVILVISPFSFHVDQNNYSKLLQNYPQTKENIIARFFKDNSKLNIIEARIKSKITKNFWVKNISRI